MWKLENEKETQTARTTQLETPDAFWGYREGYVTDYDKETGETEGEVNTFFTEAEGFPCTCFKTTRCLEPEVKELAQPGKSFAFGSGFTVRHTSCSADGVMWELTAYERNAWGKESKIYYPNYFTKSEDAEKFVSIIEYDSLGDVARSKDPDTGEILTVFNRFHELRFIKPDASKEQYIYHLYDRFGRKTEMGYVLETWDDTQLRREADEECRRPAGGIPVRQLFYDEALNCAEPVNQVGQLTRVITAVEGRTEICMTEYDEAGNVTARRTGSPADGILRYAYGMDGELTAIKGTFFSQQITYQETEMQQSNARHSGQISKVRTQYSFEDERTFQRHSEFTASYDALGRVSCAAVNEKKCFEYAYDPNGNLQRDGVSYKAGTNQYPAESAGGNAPGTFTLVIKELIFSASILSAGGMGGNHGRNGKYYTGTSQPKNGGNGSSGLQGQKGTVKIELL